MTLVALALNGETWLVCGGRDFTDIALMWEVMDNLTLRHGLPSCVVHGAAAGADTLAGDWARSKSLAVVACPPQKGEWPTQRNQRMLDIFKPQKVIAFPGSNGTQDMLIRAVEAKHKWPKMDIIRVVDVKEAAQ